MANQKHQNLQESFEKEIFSNVPFNTKVQRKIFRKIQKREAMS